MKRQLYVFFHQLIFISALLAHKFVVPKQSIHCQFWSPSTPQLNADQISISFEKTETLTTIIIKKIEKKKQKPFYKVLLPYIDGINLLCLNKVYHCQFWSASTPQLSADQIHIRSEKLETQL